MQIYSQKTSDLYDFVNAGRCHFNTVHYRKCQWQSKIAGFVTYLISTLDFLREPQMFHFHLLFLVFLYPLAFFFLNLFNGKNLKNDSKPAMIKTVRYASLLKIIQAHNNAQHRTKKVAKLRMAFYRLLPYFRFISFN